MFIRSLLTGVAAAVLACAPAAAAPVTVNLRIEGSAQTVFEGPITTDAHQVTTAAGGTHNCNGTNGGAPGPAGPTITTALDDAAQAAGFSWDGQYFASFDDFLIERIGADGQVGVFGSEFWSTSRNRVGSQVGGCQERVFAGDDALITWQQFGQPNLLLTSAASVVGAGQPLLVTVQQYDGTGALTPAAGAAIQGQSTGASGQATIAFSDPGVKRFKATMTGAVRSNAVEVCVEASSGDCAGFQSSLGSVSGSSDSTKPRGRVSSLRSGKRYSRGPRLLKGTASDDGGLKDVRLRLNRIDDDGCQFFDGSLERFSQRSRCKRATFFSVGDDPAWSYLLPKRLSPGRYTLTLKVVDRALNSTVQRLRFVVLG